MKRIISFFAAVLILTAALTSTVLADTDVFYPVSVTRSPDGTEIRKVYELSPARTSSRRAFTTPCWTC